MKRLVLVDGNALLHRAFHATPPLSTSKGELINATYGFTSMVLRSLEELAPDFIAIAWDKKAPTFRHQAYTQYKATRGPTDDNLTSQYKRVHEIVDALNIPEFSLDGYEADDLIGTLARQAVEKEKNLEVIIVTGDRDIMQVIDKRIKILMPKKTLQDVGLYGIEEFVARFGFDPKQIIDYKALAGDASDNIPGVAGIGDVTATKLVQQFGSVEKIYRQQNLKTLPERTQKLLAEGAESAIMSKSLATLDLNAPIKLDLAACRVADFDHQKARHLFEELEFKSLLNRLPRNEPSAISHQPSAADSHPEASSVGPTRSRTPNASAHRRSNRDSSPAEPDQNDSNIQNDKTQPQHTADLDLAVSPVLEKMSATGVLINLKFLDKLGADLKSRLIKLEQEIYSSIGHEFNINSPKQLSEILFDELNLPVIRRTKTGRSTDEATLSELKAAHPAISLILEYRMLFKLISTYVDALPKYADNNHRIHSTFNVEGAATGRLSSQNPNVQNIPIKGEMGSEIRKAFIAPKGKVLMSADYSQIELRILAHLTDDPNLKKAFAENIDIHTATASKIFNIPVDQITKQQRMIGKTMNFATLYGQGPHALSQQLGVDYATARTYISEYFEQFPKVKDWMAKILTEAFEKGYVETIWGRRRYIPELQSTNRMFKSAGERAAINHPIQGCIPWETKILTSWGYIPIGQLYIAEEKPPFVWDGNEWKSYEVLDRGEAQLAQIKFSNGQLFKCDTRHKVLTVDKDGYKWSHFSELTPGMKVCFSMPSTHQFLSRQFQYDHIPNVHNGFPVNIKADKDFWYWVGYYIGDGYLRKWWNKAWAYKLTYFFGDHEVIKRQQCVKFFSSLGLSPKLRSTTHRPANKFSTRYEVSINSQGMGKVFEALGLGGKNAHTKRLPKRIFTESLENRCAFIKGIMDSDGTQGVKEKNNPNIHLCQREILQEIQLLLRTMGVESLIKGPYIYKDKISYRLDIHRNALVEILHNGETAYYNRYLNRLAPQFLVQETVTQGGHLQQFQFSTRSDYVLFSRWKHGGSSSLYHLQTWLKRNHITLETPLYQYHEITEIQILDKFETTYTLSVPGSHRFDSEGVISKNTSADMIKKAMVEIDKELGAMSYEPGAKKQKTHPSPLTPHACQLILQVHDELLFECDPKAVKETAKMVCQKMEESLALSVPVIAEVKIGPNWGEMKKLHL